MAYLATFLLLFYILINYNYTTFSFLPSTSSYSSIEMCLGEVQRKPTFLRLYILYMYCVYMYVILYIMYNMCMYILYTYIARIASNECSHGKQMN